MKRVIPILAALCLVVAMAVPAFAAENDYELVGLYLFNDTLTYVEFAESVNFSYKGSDGIYVSCTAMKVSSTNKYKDLSFRKTAEDYFTGNYYSWVNVNSIPIGWGVQSWRYIDFGDSPQSVSREFYEWFVSNAIRQDCDPSVCSSVDADGDGYCDVCGGFFTPPPPGPLVEAMNTVDLQAVLTPILTMVPIGLGCWVGYKGLRKALDLLRSVLHQA